MRQCLIEVALRASAAPAYAMYRSAIPRDQ